MLFVDAHGVSAAINKNISHPEIEAIISDVGALLVGARYFGALQPIQKLHGFYLWPQRGANGAKNSGEMAISFLRLLSLFGAAVPFKLLQGVGKRRPYKNDKILRTGG